MEQHVNLSVCLAFAQFCHASGDEEFAHFVAWPVLRDIAKWILSRVTATSRGLEIKNTVGIAENRGHTVDNDAFVNMAATVVLDEAALLGRRLGFPTAAWEQAARRLVVPINKHTGVIAAHDGFNAREGGIAGATPETLAGFFPFGYRASANVEQATLAFYLNRSSLTWDIPCSRPYSVSTPHASETDHDPQTSSSLDTPNSSQSHSPRQASSTVSVFPIGLEWDRFLPTLEDS